MAQSVVTVFLGKFLASAARQQLSPSLFSKHPYTRFIVIIPLMFDFPQLCFANSLARSRQGCA